MYLCTAVDKRDGLFAAGGGGQSAARARVWDHRLSQAVHMGQAIRDVGEIFSRPEECTSNSRIPNRVQGEIQKVHGCSLLEHPRPLVLR